MAVLEDLLVVQEHDTAADRLRHRLETLPERARLAEVTQAISSIDTSLVEASNRRDEVVRRQQRHEDELALLETKLTEVDKKLYSGTVTAPRELQALQADVASLKKHQSELEDEVLQDMQDREPLDAEVARLESEWTTLEEETEKLQQTIVEASVEIDAELEREVEARTAAAAGIPADLLSQYERLRSQLGGIGAARLVNGRCSGCHLTLPATELDRLRHQPADTVILCDQCGRILVP